MTKESGKQQEQQMKDLMKLFENKVNTEDFILEVERKPAIWDSRIEAYSNNIEKQNSWSDILKNSIPEFEEKPVGEQNVLGEFYTSLILNFVIFIKILLSFKFLLFSHHSGR
ncbi:hypothetical protein AVEN_29912-1 [Araneus ventricosus]|uniref:MADF domain-containing protein n=1 Tax=Araneus ventricosus TaxID=182803 RepID=A0A4Y2L246_ARAVE|nr:hypothetical protein AVEN_29912-1 [Araneus ventricosus]